MVKSLDAIMALIACEEPVKMKTDWFGCGPWSAA
jgi:hypothetical protein